MRNPRAELHFCHLDLVVVRPEKWLLEALLGFRADDDVSNASSESGVQGRTSAEGVRDNDRLEGCKARSGGSRGPKSELESMVLRVKRRPSGDWLSMVLVMLLVVWLDATQRC